MNNDKIINNKVVITGFGVVGPKFSNTNEFKNLLLSDKNSFSLVENLGPNSENIVCGLISEDLEILNESKYKRHPRVSKLAIKAAIEAISSSGIEDISSKRVAVLIGSSLSTISEIERLYNVFINEPLKKFPVSATAEIHNNSIALAVSQEIKSTGPTITISSSCTTSLDAVFLAKSLLESNQVDICLVGGSESSINKFSALGFVKTKTLYNDENIDNASKPFQNNNKGFVMSEGASILVLERENHALSRKANIKGVISNINLNTDSISLYSSDKTGLNMLNCLENTLANIKPSYINSQALGLKENDEVERFVHNSLFGKSVPITSIKGHIGQVIGATGAFQLVSSLLSINNDFIPKTLTTGEGFEDLPIVFETAYQKVNSVAITSHGYGGNNACVLLEKYNG